MPKHPFHTTWKLDQAGVADAEQQTAEFTQKLRFGKEKGCVLNAFGILDNTRRRKTRARIACKKNGTQLGRTREQRRRDASLVPNRNQKGKHDAWHGCDCLRRSPSHGAQHTLLWLDRLFKDTCQHIGTTTHALRCSPRRRSAHRSREIRRYPLRTTRTHEGTPPSPSACGLS